MYTLSRKNGQYIVTVNGVKAIFENHEDAFEYYLYRKTIGR